jgi:thymidylate synthase
VRTQIERAPYPFPRLELAPAPTLFDYSYDHVKVLDYQHHPALRGAVAV